MGYLNCLHSISEQFSIVLKSEAKCSVRFTMFNIYVMCLLSISYLIQFKETEKGCGRPKIILVEMIF